MRILNSRRNVRFNIAAILFALCFCIAGFCLSTRISSAGSETPEAVKPDPTRGVPGKVKPTPKTKALSDAGGDLLFGQGGFGAFSLVKISRVGSSNDINYITEGREAAPIYAPDGNSILFQSFRDNDPSAPGPAELYTMDPNGFNSVRLTNDNTQKTAYCFSPDAQQIVFTEDQTMWKVSADGSGPASVLWTDPEGSTLDRPAYAPDGSKIFFVRDGWLWTINADGSNPQQFAGGINLNYFSISPDGSKIVYDNSSEIWSIGTDGSNETRILDDDDVHFALGQPKFSPDGTRILMSCTPANVCASKADGSEFAQVTNNLEAEDFVWSPDSSRFGFIGRNAATNERAVYVGQVTGNAAPEIAYGPTGNFIQYLDWQLSCDGSGPTPTPTPTPVPPNGLISEWNANDFTANDSVGGNNGLASGDMGFVVIGKVGHAFGFSGADGIVTVPDSDSLDVQTGDYTLSTWFEPYLSTEHYVAGKGACGENSSNFYIGVDPGFVPFIDISHSAGGSRISNGVPISAFNWHHLLLRKSGTTFTFYIDGSQAFSFEETHQMNVGTQPFTIGRGDECTAPQLSANGAVDEVQLYGRALSDEEIGQLYDPSPMALPRNKKRAAAACQPRVDPDIELRQVSLPVAAGRTSQLYIHLKDPPPVEGVNIDLSSADTGLLTVPSSVFFSQGETDKYVDYSTSIANTYNAVNVTATNGAATSKTTIIIAPASPDVAVSNLSAPATVSILQNFSATWTVTNHGEVTANPGPFDGRQDAVYISRDDQLFNDSTDRVVGRLYDYDPNTSQAIPLAPGQSRTVTLNTINIPSASIPTDGTYYLFVYVGDAGTVRENNGNSSDNFMSVPIQVNRNLPDLVAENIAVPSEIEPNGFYTVTWDVRNAGSVAIPGGFNHDVYFSFDGVAGNSDDVQLTGRRDGGFVAGQTKSYSQGFIIPSLPARASSDAMVYVKVDTANEVFEDNPGSPAETNNTTTKGTRFEYRIPDLTVQSVTPPADVESDSQFALGWRTANVGNKDAGQFNEHVYFSTDNVVSANDIQLGNFPVPGGLAAGQALDRIQTVSIPSNAVPSTGDYFVYVKTDGDAQVDEGPNESNNITLHSIHVRKLLRPDLQVTNITAPASAFFGQEIQVQWTVKNNGQGPTNAPAWTDDLWLGVNTTFNGAALLARTSNVSYLNAGESYIATATVRVPRGANGSYFLIVETDRNNAGGSDVNEENENNNVTTKPITIKIPPVPDLRVSNVQAPDQGFAGQPMLISWTVSNTGSGAVPANEGTWKDAVYLSRDNVFGADDRFVGTIDHAGALASGGSYAVTDASLNLPPDIFGPYYVFVKTDWADSVYEFTSEQNNAEYDQTEPGSPMTVVGTPPDLAVTTALNAPTAANAGQQIQVSFTVGNVGAFDATGAWTDGLYLSADQTFDPRDDTLVGSAPHNTLAAGQQYGAVINASLPGCLNGTYYLFAVTDVSSQVFEYDPKGNAETNNISAPRSIQLTNFSPDLQVTDMTVPPIVIEDSMPMSWTVKNVGNGPAEQTSWYDRVLIFANGRIYDLGTFTHVGALAVGGEYTQNRVVHLPPELEGEFTITVRTDAYNAVPECAFNENNDGNRPTDIQASLPDMRSGGVSGPSSAVLGSSFSVSWNGQNAGSAFGTQRSWADTVYLSRNTSLTGAQPIGGAIFTANLGSGANYNGQATVTIPDVSIGSYYLIVNADNGNNIQEGAAEGNNASTAIPISITAPEVDLFASSIVVAPTLFSGQLADISWTVTNLGTSPTTGSQWSDYIVLSRDSIFDQGDIVLGYSAHNGALSGGANYSQTSQVSIPQGVTGDYRILVVADRGNSITENNESNNVGASAPVTLQLPPPSELNITNISAPASVTLGDPATFTWTVQNASSNAVNGTWQDSVYLSTDTTWDSGDILIGQKQRSGSIAPFATYTGSLDIAVPPVETGNYHVIVRTDARNSIRESDETNNVTASALITSVGIQNLTLGVALNTTLTNGQERYLSILNTPADETMLISLTGEAGSRNELYSRFGSVVSRATYEFQGKNQGSPDQENVVANTTAGTYYTLARADLVPASFARQLEAADAAKAKALVDAEAVILKAELLPFSIRSVSPAEAGNKGYSFLNIDGAKFKDGASVKLVGPGGVQLTPLNTVYGDQSNVKALFDLNGKTAGDYQVVITNPNGQSTAWGTSFHIRSGGGHEVRSEVAGAGEVSRGRFYRYTVTTRNDGLNDAVGVPIIVILSQPLTYRLSTSNQVQIATDGVDQSTVPAHVDVDGKRYIFLYAPVVRSHESVNIGIDLQFGGGADITATSLPPIFDPLASRSPFRLMDDNPNGSSDLINCYINLLIKGLLTALSEVFPSDCAGAVASNVAGLFETMFGNVRSGFDVFSTMGSVLQAAVNTAVGCAKNLAKYIPWVKILSLLYDLYSLSQIALECVKRTFETVFHVNLSRAVDPNEMLSPLGFGPERWLPAAAPILYRINFENKPDATAPAQRIRIVDQLPPTLDPRTVRLVEMGFKQTKIEVPANRAFYQGRLQLGEDLNNLKADISAGLDITTGTVTWNFTAIDPATNEVPLDPQLGLLPPDNEAGDGDGYVEFTVQSKAGQPTRTDLQNIATIYFDDNEPIATNTTTNLIDADLPISGCAALPATSDSPAIPLSWSGSDDPNGSGLGAFDVFVSENGGPFAPFITNTTEVGAIFNAKYGKSYRFYSVAHDNAGNIEAAPDVPDAAISVLGGAFEGDVSPRPNGNNDGGVSVADVTQVRRFVAGIDDPTQYNEFQRADTSPLSTAGDGALSVGDIIQTRRFAAGLDRVPDAAGPLALGSGLAKTVPGKASLTAPRELRPAFVSRNGNRVTLGVDLTAQGDEVGIGFTLQFDPAALSNPAVVIGGGATGMNLTTNLNQAAQGRIGLILDGDPSQPLPSGTQRLALVSFDVAGSNPATASITFGDTPVRREIVNGAAEPLTTSFVDTVVPVFGPTAASVAISGRVAASNGVGIARVVVSISDQNGAARQVLTGTFGNYRFEGVAAGRTYIISVQDRKYTFANPTRAVSVVDNLSDIDFVAGDQDQQR